MKKSFRIIAVCVCMALIAGIVFATAGCTAFESADKLFERAAGRTLKEMDTYKLVEILRSVYDCGSAELKVVDGQDEASVKVYINESKQQSAVEIAGTVEGKKTEALIYKDNEKIVAKSDDIFGGSYGIKITGLEKQLKDSIFNPEKDTEYSFDRQTFDVLLEIAKIIDDNRALQDRIADLIKKYEQKLYAAIEENAEINKENTETDVLEESDVKAVMLSISINERGLKRVIKSLWKDIKKDDELKEIVDFFIDLSERNTSADEVIAEADKEIQDILEADGEGGKITLKLYLNKKCAAIMKAEITVRSEYSKATVILEFGTEFDKFEGFKITVKNNEEKRYVYFKVEEDSGKKIKVILDTNVEGMPEITFELDRKSGDGKITVVEENYSYYSYETYETTVIIGFNYKEDGGTHTFKLTSVEADGEKAEIPADFYLILKEKDKMPSTAGYKNIFEMSESEFGDFIDLVSEKTKSFIEDSGIGNLIGGIGGYDDYDDYDDPWGYEDDYWYDYGDWSA